MTCLGWAVAALLAFGQAATSAPPDQAAIRQFLLKGKIVKIKTLSKGVTKPRKVTLTDGTLTHDAVFQNIDESKGIERFPTGRVELDFRDSWHFNVAAYELSRAVGLDYMVPACVPRIVQSERGSLCWWVDWKWDEQMRVKEKIRPPDTVNWQQQWDVMRVFRELVDDTDRNQTNMLITEDWKVWMVDFSRAFRKTHALRAPEQLRRCPKTLLERIRTLDEPTVRGAVGDHLRPGEIEALLVRRRLIVEHFDALVSAQGAAAVLIDDER
jgi:hypothetical protein